MTAKIESFDAIEQIEIERPAGGSSARLVEAARSALRGVAAQVSTLRHERHLRHLSPHLLRDLGLSQGDVARLQADVDRPLHLMR